MLRRLLASALILAGCAADATDSATGASEAADSSTVTVRVHYPAGWGHRITLRCSDDWNHAIATTWTTDDVWIGTATAGTSCKPLLDDATWSIGPNYAPGDIWPHFTH